VREPTPGEVGKRHSEGNFRPNEGQGTKLSPRPERQMEGASASRGKDKKVERIISFSGKI